MARRNDHVCQAVPHDDRHRHLVQLEPPVTCEQSQVVGGGAQVAGGEQVVQEHRLELRIAEHRAIGEPEQTDVQVEHGICDRLGDGHDRLQEVAHRGAQQLERRRHEPHRPRVGEHRIRTADRSQAAEDRCHDDTVGQVLRYRERVRAAAGQADHGEPVDPQFIHQRLDVRREVQDAVVAVIGRPSGSGSFDGDHTEPALQRDLVDRRRHLEPCSRGAVEPQHDVTVGVSELGPAELTPLGDQRSADRSRDRRTDLGSQFVVHRVPLVCVRQGRG